MTTKTVPSKIVIAGNSKLSLNERFATLPKPRPVTKKIVRQNKLVYQPIYDDQVVYEEYEPTRPAMRRPLRPPPPVRRIPIENRLSFHKPKVVYVPITQGFGPRGKFFNRNLNHINHNNKTVVHRSPQKPFRNNFKPNFQNNNINNRRPFANQGGPRKFNQPIQKPLPLPKKKSVAELDRELDDYMRKSKHTPITI